MAIPSFIVYDSNGNTVKNVTLGKTYTVQFFDEIDDGADLDITCRITCGSGASSQTLHAHNEISKSWTPSTSWAKYNTTGTALTCEFTVYAEVTLVEGGDTNASSVQGTIAATIPDNDTTKPAVSLTVSDIEGWYDIFGVYVKGYSKLQVEIGATPKYNATIEQYKTTADGKGYTEDSFTTGALQNVGTMFVSARVKDSRGLVGSAHVSITSADYSPPAISSLKVARCTAGGTEDINGEYVKVTFSANVTDINSLNTANYVLKYKKTSASSYTSVTLSTYSGNFAVNSGSYIFAADSGSSYDVAITAVDKIKAATKSTSVSTAKVIEHWGADGYSLGLGKVAELEGVCDIGFQTRFYGGILPMTLAVNTDLNDVKTPNFYVAYDLVTGKYSNLPPSATTSFSLEVIKLGTGTGVKQIWTSCDYTYSMTYERIYTGTWSSWMLKSSFQNLVLFSGSKYMSADETITLSKGISTMPNGICLVFSECIDGKSVNQTFHTFFVCKRVVASQSGRSHVFSMCASNLSYFATKYLAISDTTITGHDNNIATGTGSCGITYTNTRFMLRYIYGV